MFWLSQVGGDRAVGALDSILRTSKDRSIQEKAIFALSQHGSDLAASRRCAATPSAADLSADLREKAIFWIGQSGGQENVAFLRTLYGRLKEESLREKILFSISQAGGAENAALARRGRPRRQRSRWSSGRRPCSGPVRAAPR